MKSLTLTFTALITAVAAQYSGDVVQFWNYRTSYSLNASSPRLSSLHESYIGAYVQTAVLVAAEDSQRESRFVQQLAVSYAAHDALTRLFYAQYQRIDSYLREIEDKVKPSASQSSAGRRIGEAAAAKVVKARADDGFATYVRYEFQKPAPGVYQPTPPNFPIPATQQAKFVKPFGGIKDLPVWKGPPDVRGREYEAYLKQIKEKGAKTGSTRTADETEIGYYWLESSITYWNRLASVVVGDSLAGDVLKAAQFYAKLNWAIANAGLIGFVAKNKYDSWRPITALRYQPTFLRSGRSLYTPDWEPLNPTPGHQDYLSGHAVYGSSAAGIIRRQIGSDKFESPVSLSSLVVQDNVGEVTRTFTSLSQAVKENGDSRVFVGVHFQFASDEGNKAGEASADLVWKKGTSNYL